MHLFTPGTTLSPFRTQKSASVTESTVETLNQNASPPLTSSLNSRNSASSAQESTYLRQASLLRWVRLGLAVLVVGIGASIAGCVSHVLHEYDHTAMGGDWYLPLWPVTLDVRPAVATLASAAIVAGGSLLYISLAILPSPRSRFLVQNIVFGTLSAVGATVTLFGLVYSHVVTYHMDADSRETLLTFTCGLYENARSFASSGSRIDLPITTSSILPAGFKRLCIENQVSRWMMIVLFVLEVSCVLVAAMGLISERRIGKVRKSRMHDLRDEKWSFN